MNSPLTRNLLLIIRSRFLVSGEIIICTWHAQSKTIVVYYYSRLYTLRVPSSESVAVVFIVASSSVGMLVGGLVGSLG